MTPDQERLEYEQLKAAKEAHERAEYQQLKAAKQAYERTRQAEPEEEQSLWGDIKGIGKGIVNNPKRALKRLPRDIAVGAAGIADIPSIVSEAGKTLKHTVGHFISPETIPSHDFGTSPWLPHYGERVGNYIDTMTGGETAPQNSSERLAETLTGFLTPGGVFKAIAPAAKVLNATKTANVLSKMGKMTPTRAASDVGSGLLTHGYIEGNENPNVAEAIGVGLLGGHLGAKAPSAIAGLRHPIESLKNVGASAVGTVGGVNPELLDKLTKSGYSPTVGQAGNKGALLLERMLAKAPVGGEKFTKNYEQTLQGVGKNIGIEDMNALIQKEHESAKHLAKQGAQGYHEKISNAYNELGAEGLQKEAQALENPKEMVSIKPIVEHIQNKYMKKIHTEGSMDDFNASAPGKLLTDLLKDARNGEIPYSRLDELRANYLDEAKSINKAKHPNAHRKAEDIAILLGNERREHIASISSLPEQEAFKAAKTLWHKYVSEKGDNLRKYFYEITGASDDTKAFKKLLGTDPKPLRIVREGLPTTEYPAMRDAIMSELSKGSLTRAHTNFHDLPKSVQKEVLGFYPHAEGAFKDTMKLIGENSRRLDDIINSSQTAHMNAAYQMYSKVGAGTAAGTAALVSKMDPTVLLGLAATYGAGYAGLKTASHLMTDPQFLKRISKVMHAKNARIKANHMEQLIKYKPVDKMLKAIMNNNVRGTLQTYPSEEKIHAKKANNPLP